MIHVKSGPALRAAGEILLTAGAVLGAVSILLTLLGAAFGIQPLMFKSGSMSPAIQTGDLALARTVDAADLRPGDVVSVINAEGTRVTHRLVSSSDAGEATKLKLKGDANETADAEHYTVTEAEKVLFRVPKAGYVVAWLSGPVGLFLLGACAMLLASLVLRGGRDDGSAGHAPKHPAAAHVDAEGGRGDSPAPHPRRVAATTLVSLLVVSAIASAAMVGSTVPTLAAWTNPSTAVGNSYTAKVIPAPSFTCGALGVLSVTFNWTAVPGATNYTLHYGTNGAQTATFTGTSAQLTAALAGGTAWVVANRNYGSTTWTSVDSQHRSYSVAVLSVCS